MEAQPQSTQPQPIPTYTTYKDYGSGQLTCTPPEQKAIPNQPGQSYYQIPLMYNFATSGNRVLNDFLFEACELHTSVGISSKVGPSGREEHSIMCKFDLNNPDQALLIDKFGEIHSGCAYILSQVKGVVKLFTFDPKNPEATGLKNPVYRARDSITGEIAQGRAPSMFLKLFKRGKDAMAEETLFTGLDGKPIPWALLKGVEMKFIPLIHVKRLYIGGGKASIQMEVVSAVVTSVRARNTATKQIDTIHRLQAANPMLADSVAAQLAKLTIDRQDQMFGTAPPQAQGNEYEQPQATFAGIAPTGRQMAQPTGQQTAHPGYGPQITAPPTGNHGILPNIPALNSNMQDFTANAPPRAPFIPAAPVIPNSGANSPGAGTLQLN